MDADTLIDHFESEGRLLADAAERAGWDDPVPGLAWDVRKVVAHVGGVHRWARTVVGGGTREEVDAAWARMGEAVPGVELLDWFRDGHAALVAALRSAPDDLDAFTFLPADSPRHFWARRQAHETAIHRADTDGGGSTFDPEFAQDGIAEILAFGGGKGFAIPREATVVLQAGDGPSWALRFGGERTVVEAGAEPGRANATVTGTSSDLYLWLWNRPSAAQVSGDAEIAALWSQTVKISWS